MSCHLEALQFPAKSIPFPGISDRRFEGQLGRHVGHDCQGQSFPLKVFHDGAKAGIFITEPVLYGDATVIKKYLSRVRRPPTCLLQLIGNRISRGFRFDNQKTDAVGTGFSGAHSTGDLICPVSAGNEHLAAINPVVISFSDGRCLQIGNIRPPSRFCYGKCRYLFSRQNRFYKPFFLGFGSGRQNRGDGDIQAAQTCHQTAGPRAHQFLGHGNVKKYVSGYATVCFGISCSEDAYRRCLLVKLPWKFPSFLPVIYEGNNFFVHKGLDRIPHHVMGLTEVFLAACFGTEFVIHFTPF